MGKYTPNPTIRILMLGSVGVGKNCLESRFTTMTYPPPYNPALTLNSRRYFTLTPIHAVGDCAPAEASPVVDVHVDDDDEDVTKKGAVVVSAVERPHSNASASSNSSPPGPVTSAAAADISPAAATAAANASGVLADDTASLDDRTLVASETTCSECARENNTYLVEVINYPSLQSAPVRRQVHSKAEYDAVLLVYDVGRRASFDAVPALHAEIPVCTRKNHHQHHRKAAPHTSATRSRTSGWFGGGGNETGTTGSGEIVVGLVGNKSDIDRAAGEEASSSLSLSSSPPSSPSPPRREYINGNGTSEDGGQAAADTDVEHSLLHPSYRESIHYEKLIADHEEKERRAAAAAASRRSRAAAAAAATAVKETPTTPFPAGTAPLSPAAAQLLRLEASKNDDIQKWLEISRPEPTSPTSPTLPTSPTTAARDAAATISGQRVEARDYFGMSAAADADDRGGEATMTAATPATPASSTPAPRRTTPQTAAASAAARHHPRPRGREVPTADGATLAQALLLPVPFLETSAKTGRHVEQALENLVREVLREMGRDASGTNKAGKTCRHRAAGLGGVSPVAVASTTTTRLKEKHPSSQQHHHHPHLATGAALAASAAAASPPTVASPTVASPTKSSSTRAKSTKDAQGSSAHEEATAAASHGVATPRPESAAMFRDAEEHSAVVDDDHAIVDGDDVGDEQGHENEGADPAPAVPQQMHRRESMIGRMRKMFWRKSQQQTVMPADIAV